MTRDEKIWFLVSFMEHLDADYEVVDVKGHANVGIYKDLLIGTDVTEARKRSLAEAHTDSYDSECGHCYKIGYDCTCEAGE